MSSASSSSSPSSSLSTSSSSPIAFLKLQFSSNRAFGEYGLGKCALAGFFLGIVFTLGTVLLVASSWFPFHVFGFYLMALSSFHFLEFLLTSFFHPSRLSYSAFLLNHSPQYHLAISLAMVEFFIELLIFPSLKCSVFFVFFGVVLTIFGQFVRTSAMFTAGKNFTHVVAEIKASHHILIRDGVYRFCRHPSYAGWFWWAVGTQLLLCNPICCICYTYVSWIFFKERIPAEEEYLFEFFEDYGEYWKSTPTGVPFIQTEDLTEKFKHWHLLRANRKAEGRRKNNEEEEEEEEEEHSENEQEEDR